MSKFSDLNERDRINHIRGEFNGLIEKIFLTTDELEKELTEEDFKSVKAYIPELAQPDCACGECVNMAKINGRIPKELSPILAVAKKRCEAKTW
jgi:predicted HicB family RNase H-like nuclease